MGVLTIDGRSIHVVIERARSDGDGQAILETVIDTDL